VDPRGRAGPAVRGRGRGRPRSARRRAGWHLMPRALVLEAPRRLVERQLPVPATADDDAVLRVEACGLCGTDHEQWSGALPAGFAFVPGHEVVGIVQRIGRAAAARWNVQEG